MKTIIIFYQSWGLHFKDRKHWTAKFEHNDEIWDYGTKRYLIREADKAGYNWKVLRKHRDGTTSVVEEVRR